MYKGRHRKPISFEAVRSRLVRVGVTGIALAAFGAVTMVATDSRVAADYTVADTGTVVVPNTAVSGALLISDTTDMDVVDITLTPLSDGEIPHGPVLPPVVEPGTADSADAAANTSSSPCHGVTERPHASRHNPGYVAVEAETYCTSRQPGQYVRTQLYFWVSGAWRAVGSPASSGNIFYKQPYYRAHARALAACPTAETRVMARSFHQVTWPTNPPRSSSVNTAYYDSHERVYRDSAGVCRTKQVG